jgi:type II secretory pathway pseudopilin PulG
MKGDCHIAPRQTLGFTLIEIMAAVFLTSIVMALAISFQVSLGRGTSAARERLRYQRQAVTLLDRVARDLAGAYFIARADQTEATDHPWIFLADDLTGDGSSSAKSNAVKFVTRNYQPQSLEEHASELAVTSYFLAKNEDDPGYRLLLWRKPRVPLVYDPEYPSPDDPLSEIVGENLASFELSFIDMNGGESNTWDSTQREGFDSIPLAVRIEIAMIDPNADPDDLSAEIEPDDLEYSDSPDEDGDRLFSKTVILPVRPLDWLVLEEETYKAANDAGELPDDDESEDDSSHGNSDTEPEPPEL